MGEFSAIIKSKVSHRVACKSRIWVNDGFTDGKK